MYLYVNKRVELAQRGIMLYKIYVFFIYRSMVFVLPRLRNREKMDVYIYLSIYLSIYRSMVDSKQL